MPSTNCYICSAVHTPHANDTHRFIADVYIFPNRIAVFAQITTLYTAIQPVRQTILNSALCVPVQPTLPVASAARVTLDPFVLEAARILRHKQQLRDTRNTRAAAATTALDRRDRAPRNFGACGRDRCAHCNNVQHGAPPTCCRSRIALVGRTRNALKRPATADVATPCKRGIMGLLKMASDVFWCVCSKQILCLGSFDVVFSIFVYVYCPFFDVFCGLAV